MNNTEKILVLSLAKIVFEEGLNAGGGLPAVFWFIGYPGLQNNIFISKWTDTGTNKQRIKLLEQAIEYYNTQP